MPRQVWATVAWPRIRPPATPPETVISWTWPMIVRFPVIWNASGFAVTWVEAKVIIGCSGLIGVCCLCTFDG